MKPRIGIHNLHMGAKGGGEKRTLVLADHLSQEHQVWVFVSEPVNVTFLENYFDVDLSRISFVVLGDGRHSANHQKTSWRTRREIYSYGHFRKIQSFKLDLFINNSHCSNLPCPASSGVYMCMFPYQHTSSIKSLLGRARRAFLNPIDERILGCRVSDFVDSYDSVTANSEFTAAWIERIWGRHPETIYSVGDDMGPPAKKEKIILNVGRFVINDRETLHKRQDILLNAFRGMSDVHRAGWQMHLVGGVANDPVSRAVVERFTQKSEGLPIYFHFDADFERLRDLYRRASIYWHATGYGFSPEEHPEMQEHFGLTTVEAMSAGAVPVVIKSGGQGEIVTHGVNGLLWHELDELDRETRRLIDNPELRESMSVQARAVVAKFSRSAFEGRMDAIVDRLCFAGTSLDKPALLSVA
jgi:glycosyltransferase involved in cell wall biosynthesis